MKLVTGLNPRSETPFKTEKVLNYNVCMVKMKCSINFKCDFGMFLPSFLVSFLITSNISMSCLMSHYVSLHPPECTGEKHYNLFQCPDYCVDIQVKSLPF